MLIWVVFCKFSMTHYLLWRKEKSFALSDRVGKVRRVRKSGSPYMDSQIFFIRVSWLIGIAQNDKDEITSTRSDKKLTSSHLIQRDRHEPADEVENEDNWKYRLRSRRKLHDNSSIIISYLLKRKLLLCFKVLFSRNSCAPNQSAKFW